VTRSAARGSCFALLFWLGGCQAVLGIEDAQVDPTIGASQVEPTALDDGGSSPLTTTTCELYCQTVTQTCTGQFAQYPTYEGCLAVCSLLPGGADGDTTGNTVFCRLQAAGQAPLEPSYYCPIAGPGGNDLCGSNCDALCTLVSALCASTDSEEVEDCAKSCAEVEDKKTYSVAPEAKMYEGKHVQCRLYHASVATQSDVEQHCQHALGSSPCD
jgi:hypothetical protein